MATNIIVHEPTIVGEILAAHEAAHTAARSALAHARRAGELLIEAKASIEHGQWLPWLAANLPGLSARTAQSYMRIAQRWDALPNTQRVADLPLRDALALLAEPKAAPAGVETIVSNDSAAILADRDGWQPPAGCFAFAAGATSHGVSVDVEIYPSATAGYWFVNIYRPNDAGERWGIVDGTQKPIAGWALPRMIARCLKVDGLDLAAQHWVPDVPPWTYNEVLFDSAEAWRAHWLSGGAA